LSELDEKEQKNVRNALRLLQRRMGTRTLVADALRFRPATIDKVISGRDAVSATMVFRVARVMDVPIDDLLAGRFLPPGACPHCGHLPNDNPGSAFSDEPTVVEDAPRPAIGGGGLTVVK
jgi:transcriptional regulator with XRE-family HTH domain